MERPVDFSRDRDMLCANCTRQFRVSLDWISRWEQGHDECPGCGLTCEHEDAPKVTVDSDDPALDASRVPDLFWYHSSTHSDWPPVDLDPASGLDPETVARMGGAQRVAAWAERQRLQALHVGTYEAAIHNMLRRMDDQGDRESQFYLYRVRLKPSVVVREDWLTDPSKLMGDLPLEEVCPAGVDVARYLNYREDPGGLSLALGRESIASVQPIAIPLVPKGASKWLEDCARALEDASPATPASKKTGIWAKIDRPCSPRTQLRRELSKSLAAALPHSVREQFERCVAFGGDDAPRPWAERSLQLAQLITDPADVLTALDTAEIRSL